MKIIINRCYGGFGVSDEGYQLYALRRGLKIEKKDDYVLYFTEGNSDDSDLYLDSRYRDDPDLIAVVEELGQQASGPYSNLKVVDIPDDVEWEISEYDGIESVHEVHRSWY